MAKSTHSIVLENFPSRCRSFAALGTPAAPRQHVGLSSIIVVFRLQAIWFHPSSIRGEPDLPVVFQD